MVGHGNPHPMVSSTTGAMNSVLDKMTKLVIHHPQLETVLRDWDLGILQLVLGRFAEQRARSDPLINEWMLQVRELIYDVEDWIDGRLSHPSSQEPPASDDIAEQIQEFKDLFQEAVDRGRRYALLHRESSAHDDDVRPADPSSSEVISSIAAKQKRVKDPIEKTSSSAKQFYGEAVRCIDNVEKQRKMIVHHLTDKEHHHKVVSMIGPRGVGKTTLATEIYREVLGQFDCGAFVYLGGSASVNKTLLSILQQVNPNWRYDIDSRDYADDSCRAIGPWDEQKVVATLWETLKTRSYFVVLDDVRSKWTWKRISCALPYSDQSVHRILITTCIRDVAESCCIHPRDIVHRVEVLDRVDSKKLFDSKISDSGNKSLQVVSTAVSAQIAEILKICGGIPLAISVAAGLLRRNSSYLPLSSAIPVQCQSAAEEMRKILDISYFDLSLPLKSCFLYLGTFPRNSAIRKDRLIRRWIAEGLVPKRDEERLLKTGNGFFPSRDKGSMQQKGKGYVPHKRNEESLWKIGEGYFNELIGRRLIQPEFDDEDDKPIGCTVHGAVLDFVVSLSTEENFITAGAEMKFELFPCVWVRRFFLDCTSEEKGSSTLKQRTYSCVASSSDQISSGDEAQTDNWNRFHLSRVRSLVFSGNARRMPDLGSLKLVRVLDLEDTKAMEGKQLECIGYLSLLKYLGLGGTDVIELPKQIMELEQLTTLDLRRTRVRNLPAFTDTNLVSLLADALIMPRGTGAMQNLEELSKVIFGDDDNGSHASDVAELIKDLRKLRMLGVRFGCIHVLNVKYLHGVNNFLIEMEKSKLQSIFLDNYPNGLLDMLVRKRLHYLQRFELRMNRRPWLSEIPQEMTSVHALTHLHIGVSEVLAQGLRALGKLPNLLLLKLSSDTSPRLILSRMDGFPRLKVFCYGCEYGNIQFEEGAMTQLQRLRLDLIVREKMCDFNFGMRHLFCLSQVRVVIHCNDNSTVSEVESNVRREISQNQNHPVLEYSSNMKAAQDLVIEIHNEHEWNTQIDPNKLTVIEFSAVGCGPLHIMDSVFADLAKKNPNVSFLKVDVDEMVTIAAQFNVDTIPTFMFTMKGEIIDRVVGAKKEELLWRLEVHMAHPMLCY